MTHRETSSVKLKSSSGISVRFQNPVMFLHDPDPSRQYTSKGTGKAENPEASDEPGRRGMNRCVMRHTGEPSQLQSTDAFCAKE